MKRPIIAVIVGYLVWTALWLGGNALLFSAATAATGASKPFTAPGRLAGLIALSLLCSVAAGVAAAGIGRESARSAVWVTAALVLATGIAVEAGVWSL